MFPKIIKAGLIIGAQGGEGALRANGKTAGYYGAVAVSYGLQAGVQWFGYARVSVGGLSILTVPSRHADVYKYALMPMR